MPKALPDKSFDIAIAGASFVGLALAKAFAHVSRGQLRVVVFDARPKPQQKQSSTNDARAFALSAASRNLLDNLGGWDALASQAQPVRRIELSDTSLEAGVRPTALSWDNVLEDGSPASFIVPADDVTRSLQDAVASDDAVQIFYDSAVKDVEVSPGRCTLKLADGRHVSCTLLIACDGPSSHVRDLFGVQVVRRAYDQKGIVTTIQHSKSHEGTAIQHFLPGGPFAVLPRVGDQSCITWSEDAAQADRILAMDDTAFHQELDQRLAGRLGTFSVVGARQSWPLSMHLARSYVGDRMVLVGDAAHGVHPLAGQGLNLGLRDVAALVEVVMESARIGVDFGKLDVLQRYERWRRADSAMNAWTYDGLNRMFSNDVAVLRSLREAGMAAVNRLDGLKKLFVREAAGQTGEVPKLMRANAA